jgi:hypothetical protein
LLLFLQKKKNLFFSEKKHQKTFIAWAVASSPIKVARRAAPP